MTDLQCFSVGELMAFGLEQSLLFRAILSVVLYLLTNCYYCSSDIVTKETLSFSFPKCPLGWGQGSQRDYRLVGILDMVFLALTSFAKIFVLECLLVDHPLSSLL